MESPVPLPIPIEVDAAQFEHGLRPVHAPTHAAAFHTGDDQLLAAGFDRTRTDRKACFEVVVIVHPRPVVVEVVDHLLSGLDLPSTTNRPFGIAASLEAGGCPYAEAQTQSTNDLARLALQQARLLLLNPTVGSL